jgi:uncharacterized membrane protein YphA (DoxX/SURF4 family)
MPATLKATQSEHRQKIYNRFGWMIVRFLVAVVLLIAAILKCVQLTTTPILEDGFFHARWLNQMAVILELSLGILVVLRIIAENGMVGKFCIIHIVCRNFIL